MKSALSKSPVMFRSKYVIPWFCNLHTCAIQLPNLDMIQRKSSSGYLNENNFRCMEFNKVAIPELFASLCLFWCFCWCKTSIQNGLLFLKRHIFLIFWTKMSWTLQSRFSFIGNIPFFRRAKGLCAPTYTFSVYTEYRFTGRGWIFLFFCRF